MNLEEDYKRGIDCGRLAAYLDRRGSVSIRRITRKSGIYGYTLYIQVGSSKRGLVEWLKANFGGNASYGHILKGGWSKKLYERNVWNISGQKAYELLVESREFFIEEKERVALAIEFWENTEGLYLKLRMKLKGHEQLEKEYWELFKSL